MLQQIFISTSRTMQEVYRTVKQVADTSCSVLITGESGTGKELVARAIHQESKRRDGRLVALDCAAIAPTLFDSELFGAVRGAYTGAVLTRPGLMEAANGGTLFLDEIGNLPLELQAKLLRALQEREIRRVGCNATVPFTARVIAASNRNLSQLVKEGQFRADLFYRLNVIRIQVPPLRHRPEDIKPLAELFVARMAVELGVERTICREAIPELERYEWPGNVRELENASERAVIVSGTRSWLEFEDFLPSPEPANSWEPEPCETDALSAIERRACLRAIRKTGGNVVEAAHLLGIGKTTLYRRLHAYGVPPRETSPTMNRGSEGEPCEATLSEAEITR